MAAAARDRVGELIGGRYRLERLLGVGGFGAVYRARHLQMGTDLAVKLLHSAHGHDPRTIKRFELEAQRSASLKHPNTIRVFDFGSTDRDELFIAMEYLEGDSLGTLLAREGPLPPARVVAILAQVLRALDEAHLVGLVHRDLKPDNIHLLEIGHERDFVKVLDFGISKAMREDAGMTSTGTIIGTPMYMSPEQCRGRELDGRSDLYSLGCIAYQMLSGAPPFAASDALGYAIAHVQEPAPDLQAAAGPERPIPSGLAAWVMRLLEKDPDARYPDAVAALGALTRALAGEATWEYEAPPGPIVARPPRAGAAAETRKTRAPSRWRLGAALGAAAAVLGAAAVAAVTMTSGEDARGDAARSEYDALLGEVPDGVGIIAGFTNAGFVGYPALDEVRGDLTRVLDRYAPVRDLGGAEVLHQARLFVYGGAKEATLGDDEYVVAASTTATGLRERGLAAGAKAAEGWLTWPDGAVARLRPDGFVAARARLAPAVVAAVLARERAVGDDGQTAPRPVGLRTGDTDEPGWRTGALGEMVRRVAPGATFFVAVELDWSRGIGAGELALGLGPAKVAGARVKTGGEGVELDAYLVFADADAALTAMRNFEHQRLTVWADSGVVVARLRATVEGGTMTLRGRYTNEEFAGAFVRVNGEPLEDDAWEDQALDPEGGDDLGDEPPTESP